MYKLLAMKEVNAFSLPILVTVLLLYFSATALAEPTLEEVAAANGILLGNETGLEVLPVIPGKSYNIVLIAEYAGMSEGTSSGWYIAGNPNSRSVLFTGPESPVMNKTFTVPDGVTSIGFYISPEWYPGVNWYSEKAFNVDDTDHIFIFQTQNGGYLIGFEDLRYGGDLDYQDHVFLFGPPAPEFAFVAIPITIMGFVLAFSYKSSKKRYQ